MLAYEESILVVCMSKSIVSVYTSFSPSLRVTKCNASFARSNFFARAHFFRDRLTNGRWMPLFASPWATRGLHLVQRGALPNAFPSGLNQLWLNHYLAVCIEAGLSLRRQGKGRYFELSPTTTCETILDAALSPESQYPAWANTFGMQFCLTIAVVCSYVAIYWLRLRGWSSVRSAITQHANTVIIN